METVTDFVFLGSTITVDGDSSHKIKRCVLLERKSMTNLDIILKSRDIVLLTNVCIVKASVLAWRIPGTGEPGGLPSMGSHRVGHD